MSDLGNQLQNISGIGESKAEEIEKAIEPAREELHSAVAQMDRTDGGLSEDFARDHIERALEYLGDA